MIRRFNYTERQRIKREHISISLGATAEGVIEFDASLNLSSYNLPLDATVFLEAYRQTTVMRFAVGTVEKIVLPESRELRDFERPEGILFRVKVSSLSPDRGKLLAEADRIRFRKPEDQEEEERRPLLPVRAAELGSLVAKVDFTNEPELLVNQNLGNWREINRNDAFVSLVLPNALREILTKIFIIDKTDPGDEPDRWEWRWMRFTQQLPGAGLRPDLEYEEDVQIWIDGVVSIFCERMDMIGRFLAFWEREEPK